MRQFCLVLVVASATFAPTGLAQQVGPYKVLKSARVGGEGGWDYIYADVAGRRLYIPRRGSPEVAATDTRPASPAVQTRLTVFNLARQRVTFLYPTCIYLGGYNRIGV